jgi:hypothetical protein
MALIAVDFDHVLRKADDSPCEGAKHGISCLREAGHKIMIYSCNNPEFIEQWLNNQDIRYDFMWQGSVDRYGKITGFKPVADLYIDDRGYHFPMDGSWHDQIGPILSRLASRNEIVS